MNEAKRLINRFNGLGIDQHTAKKCALICIDEIIKDHQQANGDGQLDDEDLKCLVAYWENVENDIV